MTSIARFTVLLVASLQLATVSGVAADTIHNNVIINSPTTWTASGNDHVISGVLTVNASLTIEDGCVLRFENGSYMNVYGDLFVNGTSATGVVMTRNDPTDQWWGLWFYGSSVGSLEYCTIEYGTYSGGYGINASGANSISLFTDVRVTHYWAPTKEVGVSFQQPIGLTTEPAWDVYLVYPPGVTWDEDGPPKPRFFMHQLRGRLPSGQQLDGTRLAQEIGGLLTD